MKKTLFILFQLWIIEYKAQEIKGEIKELSINTSDSSIWLASNSGTIYWTKNLKDDFKIVLQLPEPKPDLFGERKILLDRISFFSKDTLFVSGYLGEDLLGKVRNKSNSIFVSYNGGKNWEIRNFNKHHSVWVYNCFLEKNGNAWDWWI